MQVCQANSFAHLKPANRALMKTCTLGQVTRGPELEEKSCEIESDSPR